MISEWLRPPLLSFSGLKPFLFWDPQFFLSPTVPPHLLFRSRLSHLGVVCSPSPPSSRPSHSSARGNPRSGPPLTGWREGHSSLVGLPFLWLLCSVIPAFLQVFPGRLGPPSPWVPPSSPWVFSDVSPCAFSWRGGTPPLPALSFWFSFLLIPEQCYPFLTVFSMGGGLKKKKKKTSITEVFKHHWAQQLPAFCTPCHFTCKYLNILFTRPF